MGKLGRKRSHVRIRLVCHQVTIENWVGFHPVDTYTKAFSIAMISLMSVGTKGKESNVELA